MIFIRWILQMKYKLYFIDKLSIFQMNQFHFHFLRGISSMKREQPEEYRTQYRSILCITHSYFSITHSSQSRRHYLSHYRHYIWLITNKYAYSYRLTTAVKKKDTASTNFYTEKWEYLNDDHSRIVLILEWIMKKCHRQDYWIYSKE